MGSHTLTYYTSKNDSSWFTTHWWHLLLNLLIIASRVRITFVWKAFIPKSWSWLQGWVWQFKGMKQTLRKGPKNVVTAKGRCGTKWIELNLDHISVYERNCRALCKQQYIFEAGHLKAVSFGTFAHNFCSISKNMYGILLQILLNLAREWFISFFNTTMQKLRANLSKRAPRHLWKIGP